MDITSSFLWTILLIFVNAYFVVCEIILITVRKTRVAQLAKAGKRRARIVLYALKHLKIFLPTIQVGVTITSIALGLIGSPWLEKVLILVLPQFLKPSGYLPLIENILSVVSFIILTYFQLVFGELVPKTITLRKPEKYGLYAIPPLFVFVVIFWPLTWLVNMTTYWVIGLLGIKNVFTDRPYSEQEIRMILSHSGRKGEITTTEMEMAYNVFRLKRIRVDRIMRSRLRLVAFERKMTVSQIIKGISELKVLYNRYPVFNRTLDNIVGFVHVTDLYRINGKKAREIPVHSTGIIKPVLRTDDKESADRLMNRMLQKKTFLAVVVEKNKTIGIVSLTDIVDRVVKNSK